MTKEELNKYLLYASDDGDLACVVNAIEKGADIDYIGNDFTTALQYAAMNGNLDIVQYLVEKGANIEAAHLFRSLKTPLYYAAEFNH